MLYKLTLPNSKFGHLLPLEDSYLVKGRIFCVADGITRDPLSPKNFTMETGLSNYPNPSGARLAADLFCESFINYLHKRTPTLDNVRKAFIKGNQAIARLNKKHIKKIDYLINDFFGCVASGGIITGNTLFWGAITDCGIIVYNRNGKIKFHTPIWMQDFKRYEKKYLQTKTFNYGQASYRKLLRTTFRNNPKKIINGQCVSYGALTGEREAEYFMHFGKIQLSKGDLVVFYTDGFEVTVLDKKFFQTLYQKTASLADQKFVPYSLSLAKKSYEHHGHERSLIAMIHKSEH